MRPQQKTSEIKYVKSNVPGQGKKKYMYLKNVFDPCFVVKPSEKRVVESVKTTVRASDAVVRSSGISIELSVQTSPGGGDATGLTNLLRPRSRLRKKAGVRPRLGPPPAFCFVVVGKRRSRIQVGSKKNRASRKAKHAGPRSP